MASIVGSGLAIGTFVKKKSRKSSGLWTNLRRTPLLPKWLGFLIAQSLEPPYGLNFTSYFTLIHSMAALVDRGLKVVVVGAGPAGLCAAAALRQDGHAVTVLERQKGLQSRGNALVIQPAAVKALEHLKGAHEALEAISVRSDRLCYWSYHGTKPFAVTSLRDKRFETDRASVQRAMFELATSNGADVVFDSNVGSVEDDGTKAKLQTSDGQQYEADLIVAADGKLATSKVLAKDQVAALTSYHRNQIWSPQVLISGSQN